MQFTPENLAELAQKVFKATQKSAESQAQADYLKEMGKDLLEKIKTGLADPTKKNSEAALERMARASEEWRKHRFAELEAMKLAITDKAFATSVRLGWETCQSGLSYRKEEMRRLGA